MGSKLVYPVVTRVFAWLWLAGRDSAAKDVEILMLRHQLAGAQRRDPRVARKLTWTDRAWLALLAGLLPTDRVPRLRLIVTPATLLRWHQDLLRRHGARRSRRRPPTHRNIKALVLRMARENLGWGYRGIQGELAGLGIKVAASKVWEMPIPPRSRHGITRPSRTTAAVPRFPTPIDRIHRRQRLGGLLNEYHPAV